MLNNIISNIKDIGNTIRTLHDNGLSMKDVSEVLSGKQTIIRGRVKMVDNATGEVIFDRHNLVTLRGRTLALEKLFNKENTLDLNYNTTDLASKKILLFKVGTGGCDPASPFVLLNGIVSANSVKLANEIPFKVNETGTQDSDKYFDIKPTYTETSDDGHGNVVTTPSDFCYFAKTFDSIEYFYNENNVDEVGIKLQLSISADDFCTTKTTDENNYVTYKRSTAINELGLCCGNPVYNADGELVDVKNIELVTHLQFSSEPFYNNTKSSTIYYYLYA